MYNTYTHTNITDGNYHNNHRHINIRTTAGLTHTQCAVTVHCIWFVFAGRRSAAEHFKCSMAAGMLRDSCLASTAPYRSGGMLYVVMRALHLPLPPPLPPSLTHWASIFFPSLPLTFPSRCLPSILPSFLSASYFTSLSPSLLPLPPSLPSLLFLPPLPPPLPPSPPSPPPPPPLPPSLPPQVSTTRTGVQRESTAISSTSSEIREGPSPGLTETSLLSPLPPLAGAPSTSGQYQSTARVLMTGCPVSKCMVCGCYSDGTRLRQSVGGKLTE